MAVLIYCAAPIVDAVPYGQLTPPLHSLSQKETRKWTGSNLGQSQRMCVYDDSLLTNELATTETSAPTHQKTPSHMLWLCPNMCSYLFCTAYSPTWRALNPVQAPTTVGRRLNSETLYKYEFSRVGATIDKNRSPYH